VRDIAQALAALADRGVHPVGVTVDGPIVALRLSAAQQNETLADPARREEIVAVLRSHGFLYVTLALDEKA